MAVGTPTLATPAVAGSGTTRTTASFTPAANERLFVFASGFQGTTVPATPSISDTSGLTWSNIGDVPYDSGANQRTRSTLFTADVGASPVAMTVTITWSTSQSQSSVYVVAVSGTGTDYTNSATGTSATGDPSLTIPNAYSTGGAAISFAAAQGGNNFTQPTGFTELVDALPSAARQVGIAYDLTPASTTMTWASQNSQTQAIGIEIKEPTASNQDITGADFTNTSTFGTAVVAFPAQGITAASFTNASTFGTAVLGRGTVGITGTRYANPNTFGTATISGGAAEITGSLFTNTSTFGEATLTAGGSVIQAARLVNTQTFGTAVLSATRNVAAVHFANVTTFGTAQLGPEQTILAALYTNPDTFYNAAITHGSTPPDPGDGSGVSIIIRRRRR